MFASLEITKL